MNSQQYPDAYVQLVKGDGSPIQTLPTSIRNLILAAEARALKESIPTPEAIDFVLHTALTQAGVSVRPLHLSEAVQRLSRMRTTAQYEQLEISVNSSEHGPAKVSPLHSTRQTTNVEPVFDNIFEPERRYPDSEALALFDRLAGIDEQKAALITELSLATNPERLNAWSQKHHQQRESTLLTAYRQRVPLVVLQGDVGTGKTALAETVGAALVHEKLCTSARLLKLTGQVRGQGLVGQMSDEIVKAFTYAEARAAALGPDIPLLLLVDEADSIATSRAGEQMHHEDKAGVNTLLQRLDRLKTMRVRPTVIFITNRPGAVDPAIARRAGIVLRFERPLMQARKAIFSAMLSEYHFTSADIERLALQTERSDILYTASDLVDRILVRALQDAVHLNSPLTVDTILATIKHVDPSPVFGA